MFILDLKEAKESAVKIENSDMSNQLNENAKYVTKSTETTEKLKKLW